MKPKKTRKKVIFRESDNLPTKARRFRITSPVLLLYSKDTRSLDLIYGNMRGFATSIVIIFLVSMAFGQARKSTVQQTPSVRAIVVITSPKTTVWIDDVRHGKTGEDGKLAVKTVSSGKHVLRFRADGYKEAVRSLLPTQKGEIKVDLTKTTDEAELAYQEAERLSATDREKAADAYRKAIKLRPGYTRAFIGLARVLSEAGDQDGAARAIRDLRKTSPANAEASAIEGRINKENGDEDKAIASFKRAIREGKGFQPEAYTGLGLLYKERAEGFGGAGDFENETANYAEATKNLKIGLRQLSGAPDASVLYQLLGLVYERQKKYADAIAIYNEFLRFFPDSNDSSAVRSYIEQLKKQMAEQ